MWLFAEARVRHHSPMRIFELIFFAFFGKMTEKSDIFAPANQNARVLFSMGGFQSGQMGQTVNLLLRLRRFESFTSHELMFHGEMAEWSIVPHSKCGIQVTVSRVRIPVSPLPSATRKSHQ